MRRRLVAILSAMVLMLGVVVGLGTSTASAVWSCRSWASGPSAYATCDFGLGGVRAWANCNVYDPTLYFGPWVSAGQVSSVVCRNGILDWGYQTWQG